MIFRKTMTTCSFLLAGLCLGMLGAQDSGSDLEISGYTSATFFQTSRDSDASTFTFEQLELDLTKTAGSANLVAEIDIHDGGSGATGFTFSDGGTAEIEQAYIEFVDFRTQGLNVWFGKWNAPIGMEAFDVVNRVQWSLSYLYFNAIPANMTGLLVHYAPDSWGGFGIEAHISNGWDNNIETNAATGNSEKTYGVGLDYSNDDLGITWAADFFSGSETLRTTGIDQSRNHRREVFDTWLQIATDAVFEGSWVAVEYLIGREDEVSTVNFLPDGTPSDVRWEGYMIKTHVPLSYNGDVENLGLTLRYEEFTDPEAFILPTVAARNPVNLGNTRDLKIQSVTAALTFVVPDTEGAVRGILEYRNDQTNRDAFNQRRGGVSDRDDNDTVAFNLVYAF